MILPSFLCIFFRRTGLAVCLLLAATVAVAQSPTLELGPVYQDNMMDMPPSPLGFDDDGYYFYQVRAALNMYVGFIPIRLSKERFYIRRFDSDLKPVKSAQLELATGRQDEIPVHSLMYRGRIFVFSTLDNKADRTESLVMREMDPLNLTLPQNGTPIVSVDYSGYPTYKDLRVEFVRSRDSSKVLLVTYLPKRNNDPDTYQFDLFDGEMNPLWSQKITLPYEGNLTFPHSFVVDNEGKCYLLIKEYFEKVRERVGGKPNYRFNLLSVFPGEETPDATPIELDEVFLEDVKLRSHPNGNLMFAAMYSNRNDSKSVGLVYATVDGATKAILSQSRSVFTEDMFASDDDDDRRSRREEREFALAFDIHDMVLRSDGGAMLVGEITYVTTSSSYNPNTGVTTITYIYNHNNILAIEVSPEGNIERIMQVPKRQRMSNANTLLSYALGVSRSQFHFVYNDHTENETLEPGKRPRVYAPSVFGRSKQIVRVASLDASGEVKYTTLVSVREADQFAIPLASTQISQNELLLIFQNRSDRRLGRISLPD